MQLVSREICDVLAPYKEKPASVPMIQNWTPQERVDVKQGVISVIANLII